MALRHLLNPYAIGIIDSGASDRTADSDANDSPGLTSVFPKAHGNTLPRFVPRQCMPEGPTHPGGPKATAHSVGLCAMNAEQHGFTEG